MTRSARQPSIGTVLAGIVMDKLDVDESPLGNLRDFHVKWLLEFTKYVFACPASSVTICPQKQAIFLCPMDGASSPLSKEQFSATKTKQAAAALARRLPAHLGIQGYRVSFRRLRPKGSTLLV